MKSSLMYCLQYHSFLVGPFNIFFSMTSINENMIHFVRDLRVTTNKRWEKIINGACLIMNEKKTVKRSDVSKSHVSSNYQNRNNSRKNLYKFPSTMLNIINVFKK
jgi:hypothetical protein